MVAPKRIFTANRPGQDGQSEDRVFTGTNVIIVLDGVSPLQAGVLRDGWHPEALGHWILDVLSTNPSADLADVLATAINHVATDHALIPGESPASTVSILRWDEHNLDGLVLGDSPIIVFHRDGDIDILRDGRHDAVVAELRREARQARPELDDLDELIRATRPAKLARMNRYGGYWIAEATPEAGHHAILRRWPHDTVHAVFVLTDGVSCGIDDYGVPSSWPAALRLALNKGLEALLDAVHKAEAADQNC